MQSVAGLVAMSNDATLPHTTAAAIARIATDDSRPLPAFR